tara:strand:- start:2402 stop:2656 length:255 start_codon:yes stop_codon:yes gene_type:complete
MKSVYIVTRMQFDRLLEKFVVQEWLTEVFSSRSKAQEMINYTIENESMKLISLNDEDVYSLDSVSGKIRILLNKVEVNKYNYSN